MEAEIKEKIKNLKSFEKIEFEYKKINVIVQNFNYEIKVCPKPNFISKAIALILLMFIASILILILVGAGVTAGGLLIILILFLTNSLAIEISKIINIKKLNDLKQELSDVKYGENNAINDIDYSKLENKNRIKSVQFSQVEKDNVEVSPVTIKEKLPNKYFKNKMNTIKYIIEFVFAYLLCFVLTEIQSEVTDGYNDSAKSVSYSFCGILYLILFTEWIRRSQIKEKRPYYENYIYIVLMAVAFFIGVYLIKTFYTETSL